MAETVILVLCAGNIGRSPLAAVMIERSLADGLGVAAADLAAAGVIVTSAGTEAPEGHPASNRGIDFATDHELDLSTHRATRLTTAALLEADVIYGMDNDQMAVVARLAPEMSTKATLLAGEGIEIPDPHYQSDEFFEEVAAHIERAVATRTPELLALIRANRDDCRG